MPYGRVGRSPRAAVVVIVTIMIALVMTGTAVVRFLFLIWGVICLISFGLFVRGTAGS